MSVAGSKPSDTVADTLPAEGSESEGRRARSTFAGPAERFTIGDELGRGGMGKVVAARDVSLHRPVAIKQMLSRDGVDLERFEREVRITAQLEHPSIVPIHDVGTDEQGRPFYVMRRIEGEPLANRIAALTTMRARLALLPNLLAITDAAAFAHARAIIHRDIKPANILLGAYGESLLIDWGLARRLDDTEPVIPDAAHSLPGEPLTIAGYVYGTAAYMAPEQARGEVVDARADVYALGATLFHILVGKGPFEGITANERIAAATNDEPAPLDRLPPELPTELRAIVGKAMANAPADRYRNAGGMAADLRAFLEGRLVGAHVYTLGERARRFVRRNRAAVAVAALGVLGLLAVGVVAAINRIDARVADGRAEEATRAARDRAERVKIEQASLIAEAHPARAIARLRHVDPGTPYLARVRDIATKAAARGIARGDHEHTDFVTGLALGPDRRQLASVDRTGRVVVRDVETHALRRFELGDPASHPVWLDDHRLLVNTRRGIAMIDRRSGNIETVLEGPTLVAAYGGRILHVVPSRSELVELVVDTGAREVIGREVTHAIVTAGRMLVAGARGIRWLTPEGEILLTPRSPSSQLALAVSTDGRRAAAVLDDTVIEWDHAGREVHRWTVPGAARPFFGADAVYVETTLGVISHLGNEVRLVAMTRSRVIAATQTPMGIVFVTSGDVLLVDGVGVRTLPLNLYRGARATTEPDSSILAVGIQTGEVLWWDLAAFAPRVWTVGIDMPCFRDDRSVFTIDDDVLSILDLETGVSRPVMRSPSFGLATCVGTLRDGTLAYVRPTGAYTIDSTGQIRKLTAGWMAVDPTQDAILIERDGKLLQLDDARGDGRLVWSPTSPIRFFSVKGRWIAARLDDGRLLRFDRETGRDHPIIRLPGAFTVTTTGAVLFSIDRWLWRWDEAGAFPRASFPQPIMELSGEHDFAYVRLQGDTSWIIDGEGLQRQLTETGRFIGGDSDTIAFSGPVNTLVLIRPETGEKLVFALPDRPYGARISQDGTSVLARMNRLKDSSLVRFRNPVPADPVKLWKWLDDVTNAVVDEDTDALSWRVRPSASPERSRAP